MVRLFEHLKADNIIAPEVPTDWAINVLLEKSYTGIYLLAGLGILALIIGSIDCLFDRLLAAGICPGQV